MTPNENQVRNHVISCILEIAKINSENNSNKNKDIVYQLEEISVVLDSQPIGENIAKDGVDFNHYVFLMLEDLYTNRIDNLKSNIGRFINDVKEKTDN